MKLKTALALLLCSLLAALPGCLSEKGDAPDDLALGREYMLNRDFMEAEKSFERYLRVNTNGKDRWEAWNELVGLALNVRHDRNAAIELLLAMRQEYETLLGSGSVAADPPLMLELRHYRRLILDRLAYQYEQSRHYEGALDLWGSLVKDPETPLLQKAESLRNLARIYLRRLEFESSRDVLALCTEMEIPQSAKFDCRYDLADLYMIMGDMDSGIKTLRGLLEQEGMDDDKRVLSIFMLADALEQQGNRESALGLFETIRFSYPNARVVETRIEYLKNNKKE
jgi:tetratricopeptide (TPR) repeat protein